MPYEVAIFLMAGSNTMPAQIYHFDSFRLDVGEHQLTCNGRVVPLRTKVFETLCLLVSQAGRLVHKDELMKTLWPDSVVEENNLEHNLSVLRKSLRQSSGRTFIETVPRRGYRFVAQVQTANTVPVRALRNEISLGHPVFVAERESQLRDLHLSLEKAQAGARQIIFLTGEAGIGKTTLVRKFLSELQETRPAPWLGQGECLEQHGAGEAYMPVLEAFARLCRLPEGAAALDILRRQAPTWLFQMTSVIAPEERASLQQSLIGLTPERMLREGAGALEAMAAERLVILVLEDLHWSDVPTLDFLMRLARGRQPAQLLVIGTYRPAEARKQARPVSHLVQQLRLYEACHELPLDALTKSGIESYLHHRLNGSAPPALVHRLHRRTEGNPLFAATLVNSWITHRLLSQKGGSWVFPQSADECLLEAPESLRRAIAEQIRQLPRDERALVEAASAAGLEFCSCIVAAALDCRLEDVERQCATAAGPAQFFAPCGKTEWPDGTVCQQYRFTHNLYREVAYQQVPAGLRVRWHQQIGGRMEQAFAGQEDRMAPELAEHFQQARDARRAILYLKKSAQQCLERGAPVEAVFHLTSALEMLRLVAEQQERRRLELGINALLAPALSASKGFGDAQTEAAFRRAYELARQLGEEQRQFPIIFGFAIMLELRGQYRKAQEFMEKYLPHEEVRGGYILEGLDLLACSRFHQGAFTDALKHGERGARAYRPGVHSAVSATLGENPAIDCYSWAALSLWFLGHPDRALAQASHAVALTEDPAYSYSRTAAWAQLALLHQLRRDEKETRQWALRTIRLAEEQGFLYRKAVGQVLYGWSLAQEKQIEQGIEEIKAGIAGCRAAGAELDRPYHLALLAEAYMLARDRHNAAATLSESLKQARSTRSFFYQAELWRLQGQLQLSFASDHRAASQFFLRALEVAQAQQARSLELRAAVSLSRLLRKQGNGKKAMEFLSPLYDSFAGVAETPDLRDARLELAAMGRQALAS